ncbi:hypothetical protein H0H92_000603, partial [Tricholoma furcatifolium]
MGTKFDSAKPSWELDDDIDAEKEKEEGLIDDDKGWEFGREGLQVKMVLMAIEHEDDPRDEDWMPQPIRKRQQ